MLIGEPSSGGACCIQVGTDAEGLCYIMSSGQWRLTDSEGTVVEGGCSIDMPIEPVSNSLIDSLAGVIGISSGVPTYMNYYDDEALDQMMNEWYEEMEQGELAA